MSATVTKARAKDLAGQINFGLMERAAKEGVNFSRYLERADPSEEYKDGLDAYERQLQIAGIKTRSVMSEGIYADRFEAFEQNEATRCLQVEFIHRAWRNAVHGLSQRALYGSDDFGVGTSLRPYVDAAQERFTQIAPAVPIAELIALTTPIDGDAYRSVYLDDDSTDDLRMKRVAEGAEIPGAKLTAGEHTVRLHKYGRKLTTTYERLRRMRIDQVAFHIARMAIQAEVDKVAAILDVAINGDGNSNAATVYDLTDLDTAATAGTLTVKAWLAFKMKFTNPYSITTALTQEAVALQLMMLNLGSANIPLVNIQAAAGFGGFTPINPELRDNVRLGWLADAPANKIVGIDRRFALERVTEIGSNITESQRFITNQTEVLTLSEVEGYSLIDDAAVAILDIAA